MLLSSQTVLGYGQESYWGNTAAPDTFFPVSQLKAGNYVKYRKITSKTKVTGTVLNVPTFAGGKVNCTHFATQASVLAELRAMFGNESVSGTTHTFSVADVPPSYTVTEYDGEYARAYAGARMEQWVVNFDTQNGLTCDAIWWSKMAASTSWSGASVPIDIPPDVIKGTISIGGTTLGTVESGKWTFTRAIKVIHNHNVQEVSSIYPGPFIAECDLVLVVEDDSLWSDMANGTQDSVETTFDWLTIKAYANSFEQVDMDRSGDLLKQNVKLRSVYSNVDDGLVYATVTT